MDLNSCTANVLPLREVSGRKLLFSFSQSGRARGFGDKHEWSGAVVQSPASSRATAALRPQPGPALPLCPHATGTAPLLRAAMGQPERWNRFPNQAVTTRKGDEEKRTRLGSGRSELREKRRRVLRVAVCAVPWILAVALLAVTVLRHPSCSPRPRFSHVCPNAWLGFQGKCYYFSDTESDWNSSREHCNDLGASLATIDTEEEMEFMLRYRAAGDHWVGLHRAEGDEHWTWADGSAFTSGFQLRGGGRCAYLNGDGISSALCHTEKFWVCSRADSYVLWRDGTSPQ